MILFGKVFIKIIFDQIIFLSFLDYTNVFYFLKEKRLLRFFI